MQLPTSRATAPMHALSPRCLAASLMLVSALACAGSAAADDAGEASAQATNSVETAFSGLRAGAVSAGANGSRPPFLERLGDIERRLVGNALAERGLEIDPAPEGKTIREVKIVNLDVFTEDEFFPLWFNWFHWTTRPAIVEERLNIGAGDRWAPAVVQDARRTLLDPTLFATVQLVPLRSDEPGTVDMMVLTRDIWSLRLNSSFQLTGTALNFLSFSLSENNLLGYNKQLALAFLIEQDTVALGPTYRDPALFGSRIQAQLSTFFAINHGDGSFEGVSGTAEIGQPLYSLSTEWGWSVSATFRHLIERFYVGNAQRRFPRDAQEGDETVPWQYQNRVLSVTARVTRSVVDDPEAIQHNLSWGWALGVSLPGTVFAADASEAVVAEFEARALPRKRQDSYPFVRYRSFDPRYRRYRNVETMGLLEDVQLGHDVAVTLGVGNPVTGALESFFVASTDLAYTLSVFDDDIFRVGVGASTRMERAESIDHVLDGVLRYTSPILGIGRLTVAGVVQVRIDNPDNGFATLGGDNGLRGFPSGLFFGSNVVRVNAEYRTLGLELLSMWWGLAAFYDGGSVFEQTDFGDVAWYNDVGIGLRWLIPQFNRIVLRLDWGIPLNGLSPFPGNFSAGFEQAF